MKYIKAQPHQQAGLGHQFHNWALGYLLSKKFDCEFIHTPITSRIRNGSKNQTWEEFLNFGKDFKNDVEVKKVVDLPKIELGHRPGVKRTDVEKTLVKWDNIIKNSPDETLFKIPVNHFIGVLSEDIYDNSTYLKNCYWDGKESYNFGNNKTNVVVHIRRGDISKKGNANRWLDLSDYKKIMDHIRNEYGDVKFHVLSEGNKRDFSLIDDDDVNLCISESDLTSFHMMCSSDILLTGLSSFSILAAYLTKGTVFYNPLLNFTRWNNLKNFHNVKKYV